ncbi:hypothetical protein HBB16_10025 [Pseudonocardia sp. MCCB 268]|nr:hypothetical protein [Pseudonocardia cytotoxica]
MVANATHDPMCAMQEAPVHARWPPAGQPSTAMVPEQLSALVRRVAPGCPARIAGAPGDEAVGLSGLESTQDLAEQLGVLVQHLGAGRPILDVKDGVVDGPDGLVLLLDAVPGAERTSVAHAGGYRVAVSGSTVTEVGLGASHGGAHPTVARLHPLPGYLAAGDAASTSRA